jgi:ribosome-binding protein aMBF1 (putative translation factor)
MTSLNDKLSGITSAPPSGWHRKAVERRKNREWLKRAAAIGVKVLQALRRQGMTQRELADRMGVSAQQVNKIVKGTEHLTPETLVKLETVLNLTLRHNRY